MLTLIYEDNHFLIVEKPARIAVGSDASNDGTFLEEVRAYYYEKRQKEGKSGKGYCVPIHFLDRPVSGVMVFATSSKAAERINKQFRDRKVVKKYTAIVESVTIEGQKTLVDYLSKNNAVNKTWVSTESDKKAKRCELSYKVIESSSQYSFLEVKPVTGRSHQIRVQLSNIGAPIYGDLKYGASCEWNKRIALHSHYLGFRHPTTKQWVEFTANPPRIFKELIN